MSSSWFRMHANLLDTKVVWRAAMSLGTSPATAAGHLAFFWGKVSQYARAGDVSQVPDRQLEAWAAWDGEVGKFAAFVRTQHTTNGQVNDYDEFNGKLEERRAKDRAKKAALRSRAVPRDVPRDVPPTVPGTDTECPPTLSRGTRGVTKRVVQEQQQVPKGADAPGPETGPAPMGKAKRRSGEPAPWMGQIRPIWQGRYGGDPPASLVKVLRPSVEEHGADEVARRFAAYVAKTEGRYVDAHRFVATWGEWGGAPPVARTSNGTPYQSQAELREMNRAELEELNAARVARGEAPRRYEDVYANA